VSDEGGPIPADPGVIKETIVKPDGRYLIYYTFADGASDADPSAAARSGAVPSAAARSGAVPSAAGASDAGDSKS
jgi:hypothetical protein